MSFKTAVTYICFKMRPMEETIILNNLDYMLKNFFKIVS